MIPDLDCDKATSAGVYEYYVEQGTVVNGPTMTRFILSVFSTGPFILQIAVSMSTSSDENGYGKMKSRTYTSRAWTSWVER